ncbi:hypothetical protein [Pararhizobium sp.]
MPTPSVTIRGWIDKAADKPPEMAPMQAASTITISNATRAGVPLP